jgi:hypothetical protein
MSRDQEPETPNAPAPEVSAPKAPGPSAAEPETNSAMANFCKGVCTESQVEPLLALGEEPQGYQQMMATEDHRVCCCKEWRTRTYAGCGASPIPWRKSGRGYSKKRMLKVIERTRNVYENKRDMDGMPGEKSDTYVDLTRL